MNSADAAAGEFEAAVFHADIAKLTIHNFLGVCCDPTYLCVFV